MSMIIVFGSDIALNLSLGYVERCSIIIPHGMANYHEILQNRMLWLKHGVAM